MYDKIKLEKIISDLLSTEKEGGYWDYKEKHHENKAELLHDILCMANNLENHDAYIVFGIRDKTLEVVGVENDQHRRKQSDIIDFLSACQFKEDNIPEIELCTDIEKDNHRIDVLIIKNTDKVPFALSKSYISKKNNKNKEVRLESCSSCTAV